MDIDLIARFVHVPTRMIGDHVVIFGADDCNRIDEPGRDAIIFRCVLFIDRGYTKYRRARAEPEIQLPFLLNVCEDGNLRLDCVESVWFHAPLFGSCSPENGSRQLSISKGRLRGVPSSCRLPNAIPVSQSFGFSWFFDRYVHGPIPITRTSCKSFSLA